MKKNELPIGEMRMLPHKWKAIGFIVAAAAFVMALPIAAVLKEFCDIDKNLAFYVVNCCFAVAIVGLYVAAVSRDGHEDEMVRQMRLTAFFSACGFISLFIAVQIILQSSIATSKIGAPMAVLLMLVLYHLTFNSIKRRARREKHD